MTPSRGPLGGERGYSFLGMAMPAEPPDPRTVAFFDGQNLFHSAKEAFGYTYPNYDVYRLAAAVCADQGWRLSQVRFYTGVPDPADNTFWHTFWSRKLLAMQRAGIVVCKRALRYRNKVVELPGGSTHTFLAGDEKGIDVRIALDITRLAHRREYDVALVFSQDQDLSEAADEVRTIAREQKRWIKIASAFPFSPTVRNKRGINKTDWIRIDRSLYERCIDRRDYRPR